MAPLQWGPFFFNPPTVPSPVTYLFKKFSTNIFAVIRTIIIYRITKLQDHLTWSYEELLWSYERCREKVCLKYSHFLGHSARLVFYNQTMVSNSSIMWCATFLISGQIAKSCMDVLVTLKRKGDPIWRSNLDIREIQFEREIQPMSDPTNDIERSNLDIQVLKIL